MTAISGHMGNSVVGPAPWYWKTFPDFGAGLKWEFVAKTGHEYPNGNPVLFATPNPGHAGRRPVLVIRTYGRALRANDGCILLWGPRHQHNDLLVETFALGDLMPIATTEGSDDKRVWVATGEPIDHFSIPAKLPAGRAPGHYVARAASNLAEVLMLADGPSPQDAAASIYVWKPALGTVDVMPQPWFNQGNADLGYEWITRVTRDSKNGHILGDGIRIAPFELDEHGRWLREWPNRPRERLISTWLRVLRRGH